MQYVLDCCLHIVGQWRQAVRIRVDKMAKQYDLVLRLFCLGDSGVGKTCMICYKESHVARCEFRPADNIWRV